MTPSLGTWPPGLDYVMVPGNLEWRLSESQLFWRVGRGSEKDQECRFYAEVTKQNDRTPHFILFRFFLPFRQLITARGLGIP